MVEIAIDVDASFANPYDPDQIDVELHIETPSRAVYDVPAFWSEPRSRSLVDDSEVWTPDGAPGWRARYTPLEEGVHHLWASARDAGGEGESDVFDVTATPAERTGFARRDACNPRYFAIDGGGAWIALGVNIDWATEPSGSYAYDDYLADLADGGGNWTRLWMTHFGVGWSLEWNAAHPSGEYHGLGAYNQAAAARLDHVFQTARDLGVYVQLVFHQHSQFETAAWSSWADNPYNQANGGPCATSAEYFDNPEALRLARALHRYVVARWSAFPSLFAWELWNEADLIAGVLPSRMNPWAREAADDVRAMDPMGHLVSTSYGSPVPFPGFDLDSWDFNNRHMYAYGSWLIPYFTQPYFDASVPLMLSEFGVDWQGQAHVRDTLGVNMHNGVWSAVFNGYAGGAMNWWWDNYVDPNALWDVNAPMKAFLADVDIAAFNQAASVAAMHGRKVYEAYALRSERDGTVRFIAWIHDRVSGWLGPMENPPLAENVRVEFPDQPLSDEDITSASWFDTWTGTWGGELDVSVGVDGTAVALPDFTRDIAVLVTITPAGDDDANDDVDDDDNDDDLDDDAHDDDGGDDDVGRNGDDDDDDGCGC